MAQPPPERRSAEEWLGVADRHLAEADERLRRVEELVLAGPVPDGRGRALAEELLETMRRSREAMLVHRKLLGELTGVADPDPGSDEL